MSNVKSQKHKYPPNGIQGYTNEVHQRGLTFSCGCCLCSREFYSLRRERFVQEVY